MKTCIIVHSILIILLLSSCSDGKDGLNGSDGDDGKSANCSIQSVIAQDKVPNGGALITCSDGTSHLILNGSNGKDGDTPKSMITSVQLCTKDKTVYPEVFAEVAFCIDKILYAVYSENNGFLTQIPNGSYVSRAHNSNCSFKVDGCSVKTIK